MKTRWADPRVRASAIIACIALFLGAFYFPLFTGQLFRRDSWTFLLGCRRFVGESFRRGEFPGWYPYEALGIPLHAQAACGALHPLSLLAIWIPPEVALSIQVGAALVIAAIGAWQLAAAVEAPLLGRALAAIAYGASGCCATLTSQVVFLWGASVLPLLLALCLRSARDGWARARIALFGIAAASTVWIGDIEGAYVFTLTAGIVGLAVVPRATRLRYVAGGAMAALLFALLAAPQWLPTLLLRADTPRASGIPWAEATQWSFHPLRLPELFLAGFEPVGANARTMALKAVQSFPLWMEIVGGSAIVTIAAFAGLRAPETPRRLRIALATTAAVGLLAAMGRFAGVYWLFYKVLPAFSGFRWPEKLLPLFVCCFVALAAIGIGRLSALPTPAALRAWFGAALVLLGLATVCWLAAADREWLAAAYLRELAKALGIASALPLLAALGLRWGGRGAAFTALALAAMELVASGRQAVQTRPWRDSAAPPTVAELQKVGVAEGKLRVALAGTLDRPSETELFTPREAQLASASRALFEGEQGGEFHLENAQTFLAGQSPRVVTALYHPLWFTDLAPRFNVGVLIGPRSLERVAMEQQLPPLSKVDDALLIGTKEPPWPRVFWAEVVAADSEEEDPFEQIALLPPRHAVIEGEDAAPAPHGTIVERLRTPQRLDLDVTAEAPGHLVINEAFDRGWRAEIDGREVPLERANAIVKAVRVPAGSHHVSLRFEVRGLKPGFGLLFAGLLLLLALVAGVRMRSR